MISAATVPLTPEPVDSDQITKDLLQRFGGDDPDEYVKKEFADPYVIDTRKMQTDDEYRKAKTEDFLRNAGKMEPLRAKIVSKLEAAGQTNVNRLSQEVEELMWNDAELETHKFWEVKNVKAVGVMALEQAEQYMFFTKMLKAGDGSPIPYPEDRMHEERIKGWDKSWATPDGRALLKINADKGNAAAKDYLTEIALKENWEGLAPDKQREMLQAAANRCLDRLAALGEKLLVDKQPMGILCLTLAGKDKFTPNRLKLIQALPNSTGYLQRLGEIRKMPDSQVADLTLADETGPITLVTNVRINEDFDITDVFYYPPSMRQPPVRFNNHEEGDAASVVQQMMGIIPMKEVPGRPF